MNKTYFVDIRWLCLVFTVLILQCVVGMRLLSLVLLLLVGDTEGLFLHVWSVPEIRLELRSVLIQSHCMPKCTDDGV